MVALEASVTAHVAQTEASPHGLVELRLLQAALRVGDTDK